MYNPFALPGQSPVNYFELQPYTEPDTLGNLLFKYPLEPSWQLASTTTRSSAMPGGYSRSENYYLCYYMRLFITKKSDLVLLENNIFF